MEKNDPFFSLSPLEFKIFSRIRADWMGRERQDKNRRSMLLRFAISKTRGLIPIQSRIATYVVRIVIVSFSPSLHL